MVEGELLRRIVCQMTFRHTPHGNEEIVNIEAIRQIVRDMRREFPCYPICKKYSSDMTNTKNQSGTRCDKGVPHGCFAWKKWVLKWLGEEK